MAKIESCVFSKSDDIIPQSGSTQTYASCPGDHIRALREGAEYLDGLLDYKLLYF